MSRGGYSPEPPRIPRPVTTTNFDEWCADSRDVTFEEYMAESIPVDAAWRPRLPHGGCATSASRALLTAPPRRPVTPPLRMIREGEVPRPDRPC
jgi:hypothetical protein